MGHPTRLIGAMALLVVAGWTPSRVVSAQTSAPQPPVLTSFSINSGADTVSAIAPTVMLVHTVVGTPPSEYRVSRRADFVGAPWVSYVPTPAIRDWYDAAGEACGPRHDSHRVTLYLQVRANLGEEMRIVDGQRQLVPARVESNVLRASICARLPGE
jgi:hypothetical protein